MATRKKFDAVATVGKFTNGQGEEKKRFLTVGAVFEDDQGRLSMKLDGVPVSPEWSGWISFYEPKQQGESRQSQPSRPPVNRPAPAQQEDDEIPF